MIGDAATRVPGSPGVGRRVVAMASGPRAAVDDGGVHGFGGDVGEGEDVGAAFPPGLAAAEVDDAEAEGGGFDESGAAVADEDFRASEEADEVGAGEVVDATGEVFEGGSDATVPGVVVRIEGEEGEVVGAGVEDGAESVVLGVVGVAHGVVEEHGGGSAESGPGGIIERGEIVKVVDGGGAGEVDVFVVFAEASESFGGAG